MTREQEQSGVIQNTVLELLSEAECQLQAGHFQKALATLQDGDKLFPKEKGVKEALAVAKVMVAVKGGIKRGCNCGARIQNDLACDWYSVLRLDSQGDEAAIKRKFKQYALHCHPDKNSSSRAGEAFKWVSEAYAVLSDDVKRAMYNKQRALLATPCVSCILKSSPTLEERIGTDAYRRSTSVLPQPRAPETFYRESVIPGLSRFQDTSRSKESSFHSDAAYSFGELRGSAAELRRGAQGGMADPAFQQRRGYGARAGATETEETWQDKRERWLRQLDKSKAKAQVRKQAWDDGLRSFEAPSAQTRPSSTQPPPLHSSLSGRPPVSTANPLFASEVHSSEGNVNRPGVSSFEGSLNGPRTEGISMQAPGSFLHEAKGFGRAGRFAVDARPTGERGGTYELFTDGSGRKVLSAGEFAANHKVNITQGAFPTGSESEGFGKQRSEAGGPSVSGSEAHSDAADSVRNFSSFGRQSDGLQKPFTGGVLRQRKDTNRSQEGSGGSGVEGSKGGLESERAWSKDLPGGEHGRRVEKENVGSSGARVYSLFGHHRSGNPFLRTDSFERADTASVPSAHEQLMSTLRRLKEDGLGAANGKKVGLSFGGARASTLKKEGYGSVYYSPPVEPHGVSYSLSAGEDLLRKLRELRMDDGGSVK